MTPGLYTLYGISPSYFTRKAEAVLRYMRVPHETRRKTPDIAPWLEARAGTHMIPVLHTPEDWVIHDSTFIARLLDQRFPDRAVIPRSPAQRILCLVLDDWVDEWLTRAALHFRWAPEEGAQECAWAIARGFCAAPLEREPTEAERTEIEGVRDLILPWGRKAMKAMAAGPEHGEQIRAEFAALLTAVDAHARVMPGFFGPRRSLADLGFAGAMMAHFIADSVPRAFVEAHAPALAGWTQSAWAAQAGDEDWLPGDAIPETLEPLFALAGAGFGAYLRANRAALEAGTRYAPFEIDGAPVSMIARKTTEAARRAIAAEIETLSAPGRRAARDALAARGLLTLYEDDA